MAINPVPADRPQQIPLIFYATNAGNEPVRSWLKDMDTADRRLIGLDLMTAQYAWPIGMPLCRAMGRGLFEVRTDLSGRISRVFICFVDGKLVALHGIIKKTQQTSKADLELARKRQSEVVKSSEKAQRSVGKK